MIEISFDESFKRAFKKRFQGDHELERKFRTKLEKFQENPFDPSLKTHKLSGKLKELWSFSIEYNQRVIFEALLNQGTNADCASYPKVSLSLGFKNPTKEDSYLKSATPTFKHNYFKIEPKLLY